MELSRWKPVCPLFHLTGLQRLMVCQDPGRVLSARYLPRTPCCLGSSTVLLNYIHSFGMSRCSTCYTACLLNQTRCFLLTHAHMDHIASLIVSAGSFSGPRKRIYASMETLKDLESVFKPSRIWPNLASWNEQDDPSKYLYSAYARNLVSE